MTIDAISVAVTPAGTGRQMVRLSLPLSRGFLRQGQVLSVTDGTQVATAAVRVLTWYPTPAGAIPSARRAMLTFPWTFSDRNPILLNCMPVAEKPRTTPMPVDVKVDSDRVTIAYHNGPPLVARLLAPPCKETCAPEVEIVESSAHFLWQRFKIADSEWSRVIEVRVDSLGTVTVIAHLQQSREIQSPPETNRLGFKIAFLTAPDFGWELCAPGLPCALERPADPSDRTDPADPFAHSFAGGEDCVLLLDGKYRVAHPAAAHKLRGGLELARTPNGAVTYRYLRCTAAEKVPMQSTSWRRAELVVTPVELAPLTETLEYPHVAHVDWRNWDALYGAGRPIEEATLPPDLRAALRKHYDMMEDASMWGDDWGNHGGYDPAKPHRVPHGMNRLNHCPAIFFEGWRSGERRLVNAAVLWCQNFHDLSIWWGPDHRGGTRYPQAYRQPPADIPSDFMWRSDEGAADFCTKGFDSFFLAYEQTGDPLMLEALDAQVQFAKCYIHTGRKWQPVNEGHPRNIGTVIDFVRLHRYTGRSEYLEQALRLFRELRDTNALQPNNLFTEAGFEPVNDNKFIPADGKVGETYIKPYILGYALEGLPAMLEYAPDEPRLRDTVLAVSDFLAKVQDPVGSWRYPHPLSPCMLVYQAPEHAMQIASAARVIGAKETHLDAIERMLRLRLLYWLKTGRLMVGLGNWESACPNPPKDLWALYDQAVERDFRRDWAEGPINDTGAASNDGLVYVPELVQFYLEHRSAARLLAPPEDGSALKQVLDRVPAAVER